MKASRLLAAYLEKNGLSTAAFASRCGANRSQIYRLLVGERGPSTALAVAIEEATGGAVRVRDWSTSSKASSSRHAA